MRLIDLPEPTPSRRDFFPLPPIQTRSRQIDEAADPSLLPTTCLRTHWRTNQLSSPSSRKLERPSSYRTTAISRSESHPSTSSSLSGSKSNIFNTSSTEPRAQHRIERQNVGSGRLCPYLAPALFSKNVEYSSLIIWGIILC